MRVLLSILAGAWAFTCTAQPSVIHRSYADHLAGRGETVGDYQAIRQERGAHVLHFRMDGRRVKVPCEEIWGFTVNGVLFRIDPVERVPVRLMARGVVCYYENGFAHLRMQQRGTELEAIGPGHRSYLGRTLDGEIVPAVFAEEEEGRAATFRSAHPQFETLFRCIGARDDLDNTRQCVVDFEAMLEGDGLLEARP